MQVVGLDRWPRFVADAQARAREAAPIVEVSASRAVHRETPATQKKPSVSQNEHDLASVIESEAGSENETAKTAVGWTLRNRMLRNGSKMVNMAWHGYAHSVTPSSTSLQIARGILDGSIADSTNGATHFYTPGRMSAKGESTLGRDVGGGLETVPGSRKRHEGVETYRPSWANDPNFLPRPVNNVAEKTFKFYRKNGDGIVR